MIARHRAALVAALCAVTMAVPALTVATTQSAEARAATGPFAIGVRDFTFVDKTRPTPAHSGCPALPSRTLPTRVWYPAIGAAGGPDLTNAKPDLADGPYPLVEFSHGFGASGPDYGLFIRQWAAAGYVVAAPTFPLTNSGTPCGPDLGDYVEQPKDVSFVITNMLKLNATAGGVLHGVIRPNEIAASGHSLGAVTTLGVTYSNGCCEDHRIKAAMPFAGIELPFGGGGNFNFPPIPMLYAHGTKDSTIPYAFGKSIYADASAPKWFVTLIGAEHVSMLFDKWGPVLNQSAIDFLDFYLKGDATGRSRLFHDSRVPGVASLQYRLS